MLVGGPQSCEQQFQSLAQALASCPEAEGLVRKAHSWAGKVTRIRAEIESGHRTVFQSGREAAPPAPAGGDAPPA